jgi:endonuclease YncB( thermonuclease family)
LSAGLSAANPTNPADVYVIDGDTIRVAGGTVRLVGFDAPKLGSRAHCG